MILVCSEACGVLAEIEKALERDEELGGLSLLLPIDLDGYVHDWIPKDRRNDLPEALRKRVVADFRDPQRFEDSLARLSPFAPRGTAPQTDPLGARPY